jgi:hypothetical protein
MCFFTQKKNMKTLSLKSGYTLPTIRPRKKLKMMKRRNIILIQRIRIIVTWITIIMAIN